MNLPASLHALDRPVGLPPSLLLLADDINREQGPDKVRKRIESIGALRSKVHAALNAVRSFFSFIFIELNGDVDFLFFFWRVGDGWVGRGGGGG